MGHVKLGHSEFIRLSTKAITASGITRVQCTPCCTHEYSSCTARSLYLCLTASALEHSSNVASVVYTTHPHTTHYQQGKSPGEMCHGDVK